MDEVPVTCQRCGLACEQLERGTWWCAGCRKLYRRVALRPMRDGEGFVV